MHTLSISNFGPIKSARLDVSKFLVLIGPQSSGKSTISKLIYYFLSVRDEVVAFILESAESDDPNHLLLTRFKKRLQRRFVEFWGPTPQPTNVSISYQYSASRTIEVRLDEARHKYTNVHLSKELWDQIRDLLHEKRDELRDKGDNTVFLSAAGKANVELRLSNLRRYIRNRCCEIFDYDKELLFIPAGRSLLSTLSDQIQNIHPHLLDYPMRQFVDIVNGYKSYFIRALDDIVREKRVLSDLPVPIATIRMAQSYMKRILKGEYIHDREGGKLFVNSKVYTKINFASSGQQESVWILLTLFLLILEKSESLVVIEEPEAHLFPVAQKEILEFISFVHNRVGCNFIITTHSPYLISCINNLLYASIVSEKGESSKVAEVIPREIWLREEDVTGYFVDQGKITSLISTDQRLLKCELLDTASDQINEEFSRMLALEGDAVHA